MVAKEATKQCAHEYAILDMQFLHYRNSLFEKRREELATNQARPFREASSFEGKLVQLYSGMIGQVYLEQDL